MPRKQAPPRRPAVLCGRCRRELVDDLCRSCIGIITHLPPPELMTPHARKREVLSYREPIVGIPEDIRCERVYSLCCRRYQGDSWVVVLEPAGPELLDFEPGFRLPPSGDEEGWEKLAKEAEEEFTQKKGR